jgi:hypothetical protein
MTNCIEDYLPGLGYLALLVAAVSIYLKKDFALDALAIARTTYVCASGHSRRF